MSIISEVFNKLLELNKGEKIEIACATQSQLHSFRTMLYKEKSLYKKKTGIDLPLTCNKVVIRGQLILEVILRPVAFIVRSSNEGN